MVFTRAADDDIGREKTMRAVRDALKQACDVELFRLHSIAETRRAGDVVFALLTWLWSLLSLRPMALQCVLFATRSDCETLVKAIRDGGFDCVYVDMVRSQFFLRTLRRALPALHIITDLDDLISRRMRFAAGLKLPLSLGFAGRFLPPLARDFIERLLPARLVYRYEAAGVARAEDEMARASQAVVLVSGVERGLLKARLPPERARHVHAITPPAQLRAPVHPLAPPLRFVFVGSDSYQPNRLAIEFLLRQWLRARPPADLHIYGRQKHAHAAVPGVVWHGFVADVAQAYAPGSVAVMPCFVPGGIKTKVVEGWSFGCPVLGNSEAFEGLAGGGYPLALPLAKWGDWLAQPDLVQAQAAAQAGQGIAARLSPDAFRDAWAALVPGAAGR